MFLLIFSHMALAGHYYDADSGAGAPGLVIEQDNYGMIHYSNCQSVEVRSSVNINFSGCESLGREIGYFPDELLGRSQIYESNRNVVLAAQFVGSMGVDVALWWPSFWFVGRAMHIGNLVIRKSIVAKYGIQTADKALKFFIANEKWSQRITRATSFGSRVVLSLVLFSITYEQPAKSYLSSTFERFLRFFDIQFQERMRVTFNPAVVDFPFDSVGVENYSMSEFIADVEYDLKLFDRKCMTPITGHCRKLKAKQERIAEFIESM